LTFSVLLTGADGCGKDTQAALLAGSLRSAGLSCAVAGAWDALPDLDPSRSTAELARTVGAFLARLSSPSRALFLACALREAEERARRTAPDVLILNAGFAKYRATEELLGSKPSELAALGGAFTPADLAFRLEAPLAQVAARKPFFTPYECGLREPTRENFLDFQARLRERLAVLTLDCLPVDSSPAPSQVAAEILGLLAARFAKAAPLVDGRA
jgi:hypothetical protein